MRPLRPTRATSVEAGGPAAGPLRRRRLGRLAGLGAALEGLALRRSMRGTLAALGLLLGFGGYALALGGQGKLVVDEIAGAAGLGIRDIEIRGVATLGRAEILARLGLQPGESLPTFDATAARERLIASPGVAAAAVRKVFPDRLVVEVEERVPFALWQMDGGIRVIDQTGATVLEQVDARFAGLPLVVGAGAAKRVREATALVATVPDLAPRIRAAVLVAERRWNLVTEEGVEVRLPETDAGIALAFLARLQGQTRILDRDISAVDLRAPDRLFVRLNETAVAARRDAQKLKAKPKGTGT